MKKAINLAQDRNINLLVKKLNSYVLRDGIVYNPEKDNLGH